MIEREIADQAQSLLASSIACLFEDEHIDMESIAKDPPARAEQLRLLCSDGLVLAQAMLVVLRRAEPQEGA